MKCLNMPVSYFYEFYFNKNVSVNQSLTIPIVSSKIFDLHIHIHKMNECKLRESRIKGRIAFLVGTNCINEENFSRKYHRIPK